MVGLRGSTENIGLIQAIAPSDAQENQILGDIRKSEAVQDVQSG